MLTSILFFLNLRLIQFMKHYYPSSVYFIKYKELSITGFHYLFNSKHENIKKYMRGFLIWLSIDYFVITLSLHALLGKYANRVVSSNVLIVLILCHCVLFFALFTFISTSQYIKFDKGLNKDAIKLAFITLSLFSLAYVD